VLRGDLRVLYDPILVTMDSLETTEREEEEENLAIAICYATP
jgi:hypothetical protein